MSRWCWTTRRACRRRIADKAAFRPPSPRWEKFSADYPRERASISMRSRRARIGEAGLGPNEALKRAAALTPLDVGERTVDHGAELSRLAREGDYSRLSFVTDHPGEGQSTTLRVITVGRPQNNLALTSLQVERAGLDAPRLEARVEVRSFSNR